MHFLHFCSFNSFTFIIAFNAATLDFCCLAARTVLNEFDWHGREHAFPESEDVNVEYCKESYRCP